MIIVGTLRTPEPLGGLPHEIGLMTLDAHGEVVGYESRWLYPISEALFEVDPWIVESVRCSQRSLFTRPRIQAFGAWLRRKTAHPGICGSGRDLTAISDLIVDLGHPEPRQTWMQLPALDEIDDAIIERICQKMGRDFDQEIGRAYHACELSRIVHLEASRSC